MFLFLIDKITDSGDSQLTTIDFIVLFKFAFRLINTKKKKKNENRIAKNDQIIEMKILGELASPTAFVY